MARSLYALIQESAEAALSQQNDEGAMQAGNNGPWHQQESPVRNTGHWLITFLKAHEISGQQRFLEAAERAATYLCSQEANPLGAAFLLITDPEVDHPNGLIGQAWTIEALAFAATVLGNSRCRSIAERAFLQHPFDSTLGLWRHVGVDGRYGPIWPIFNQQLWFAAAGALLLPSPQPEIEARVICYLNHLPGNLTLYSSGVVYHPLAPGHNPSALLPFSGARSAISWLNEQLNREGHSRQYWREISVGYHSFNLYALGMLKQVFPDHPSWADPKIHKALAVVDSEDYWRQIDHGPFCYSYHPTGFEVAFALQAFGVRSGYDRARWVCEQLAQTYDHESKSMSRSSSDPLTLSARLYEATRLSDVNLDTCSGILPEALA